MLKNKMCENEFRDSHVEQLKILVNDLTNDDNIAQFEVD